MRVPLTTYICPFNFKSYGNYKKLDNLSLLNKMKHQTKFYSVNKNGYQITKNDPAVFTN